MKRFFKERSFYLMLCVLYSLCAFRVVLWLSGIEAHNAVLAVCVLLWVLIIGIAEHNNVGWIPLVLLSIAFIVSAYTLKTAITDPFFRREAAGELSVSNDIAVMLLMGALCLIFSVISKNSVLRMITAAGWVVFWIVCVFVPLSLPKTAVVLMLPAVLFELARAVYITAKGSDRSHFDALRSPLMAFFIAGSLVMFIMPTSQEPYHWKLPRAIVETVQELYEKIETAIILKSSGSSEFGMSFGGIGENTNLLGRKKEGSGGVMELTAETALSGRIYLKGNIWEIYDGEGWSTQLNGQDIELLSACNDTAEHIYALWRYEGDRLSTDFFRKGSVYIRYSNTKTRTMFSSLNVLNYSLDEDKNPWSYYATGLLFDYVEDDAEYSLRYLEENSKSIGELISASEGWTYGVKNLNVHWFIVNSEFSRNFSVTTRGLSQIEATLKERQELIYDTYLEVPDFVSEKVYELADSITEGLTTDYEKVLAIEDYLRKNYTYTLTPESPKGRNFLDWFLFEADEGYCTWFATAASILARCEGIPSRYVQGYCVSLREGKSYVVTGEDAHAWSECYISGYGWVTVEATPGYSAGGTGTWLTNADILASAGDGDDEWFEEEELDAGFIQPSKPKDEETELEEEETGIHNNYFAIAIFIIGVGAVAAGAILYDKYVLTAKRIYDAASYSRRAELDLERIVSLAKKTGCSRKPEDSINVFLVRLSRYIGADTQRTRALSDIYERVFFGGSEIGESEWLESRWLRESMEKKLRERIYFWRK